ncbi:MAG: helix-turn-helix transcriptional regulator [Oscillospiraceae bacterium]|jgi:transcriptional regulator with XRE-family HTH domain|nr:helix-turn-helix transcriptional regulator [Oscillospiraceae bacterium]
MTTPKRSVFATRLYEYRLKNNLTQQKLATLVGVTQQSIWKWETDRSEPSIEKLRRLAELFNVPTDALLGLSDVAAPLREIEPKYPGRGRGRAAADDSPRSIVLNGSDLENAVRDILNRLLDEREQRALEA